MGGWLTQAEGDQLPPLAPLPVTKINRSDVASRYHVAPTWAQRMIELVLRQPNEQVPSWATPALLSIVAASLLLAQENDEKYGLVLAATAHHRLRTSNFGYAELPMHPSLAGHLW